MENNAIPFVYIDTMILLHFKRPNQIDWLAMTTASKINIVVAPVVTRELEKHKIFHQHKRIRARANEIIAWFNEIYNESSEIEIRRGVTLIFEDHEPAIDFNAFSLSKEISDDHLIASIISRSQKSQANVFLATNDFGLKVKCRARQIELLPISERERLPEEPDDDTQEIRRLKANLAKYENRLPKIQVGFEGEKSKREFLITLRPTLVGVQTVKEVKSFYSPLDVRPRRLSGAAMPVADAFPKNEVISTYNREISEFYIAWDEYLKKLQLWEIENQLSFESILVVSNSGTAPASRIDVKITFPEFVKPFHKGQLPEKPIEPQPPSIPGMLDVFSLGRMMQGKDDFRRYLAVPAPLQSMDQRVFPDKREISCRINNLKHTRSWQLDPFFVRFEIESRVQAFQAEYVISTNELPEETSGKITFDVKTNQA
jgi:rRNA-processing protein FCF1